MKKTTKIVQKMLLTAILVIISLCSIWLLKNLLFDKYIPLGSIGKEKYGDKYGFQHYTEYYKYRYQPEKKNKFYKIYSKIDEKSLNEIKIYYFNFKEKMEIQNRKDEFDLNENTLDVNDYYVLLKSKEKVNVDNNIISRKYTLYIFDTETCILYYMNVS